MQNAPSVAVNIIVSVIPIVGIVMGFAIVPVIYSIAEEALSNVPKIQIAGSLALGATRWAVQSNQPYEGAVLSDYQRDH